MDARKQDGRHWLLVNSILNCRLRLSSGRRSLIARTPVAELVFAQVLMTFFIFLEFETVRQEQALPEPCSEISQRQSRDFAFKFAAMWASEPDHYWLLFVNLMINFYSQQRQICQITINFHSNHPRTRGNILWGSTPHFGNLHGKILQLIKCDFANPHCSRRSTPHSDGS